MMNNQFKKKKTHAGTVNVKEETRLSKEAWDSIRRGLKDIEEGRVSPPAHNVNELQTQLDELKKI